MLLDRLTSEAKAGKGSAEEGEELAPDCSVEEPPQGKAQGKRAKGKGKIDGINCLQLPVPQEWHICCNDKGKFWINLLFVLQYTPDCNLAPQDSNAKLEGTDLLVRSIDPGIWTVLTVYSSNGTVIKIGYAKDNKRLEQLRLQGNQLRAQREAREKIDLGSMDEDQLADKANNATPTLADKADNSTPGNKANDSMPDDLTPSNKANNSTPGNKADNAIQSNKVIPFKLLAAKRCHLVQKELCLFC